MKYLPLALMLCSAPVMAENYVYKTDLGSEFIFHMNTVELYKKERDTMVNGLWTYLGSDKSSTRMRITVTGCAKNSGTMTTFYFNTKEITTQMWVADGPALYDHFAVVQCLAASGTLKNL